MDFREKLRSWLNQTVRIKITDGRILVGKFCCTDRDANVILGQCEEFLPEGHPQEPRNLGLAMVPGRHILQLSIQQHNEEEIS